MAVKYFLVLAEIPTLLTVVLLGMGNTVDEMATRQDAVVFRVCDASLENDTAIQR